MPADVADRLVRDPRFQALPPADQQAMLAELGAAPAPPRAAADDALVRAVIHVESGGNPLAVSRVGARGLMQLMPATARELGVDASDPAQNVEGGTRYLSQLLGKYGDQDTALMAYNWGPGRVDRWIAGGRKGPVPAETLRYVSRVNAQLGGDAPAQAPGFLERALSALDPIGTASAATLDEPKRGGQPDPRQLVRDPRFQALPTEDQAAMLAELDPRFAALPPADRDAFLVELKGEGQAAPTAAPRPETGTLSNLGAGVLSSVAGADRLAANALELVGADETAATMRGRAKVIEGHAAQYADDTLGGVVAQGVGAAPMGVLESVAAAAVGGPVAGFAGLGALSKADQGIWEAAKAAVIGGLTGKAAQLLSKLPIQFRVPAFAALFGGQAGIETGDPKQAVAGAVTGAGFGALPTGVSGAAPRDRVAEMVEGQRARAETAQRDTATLLGATPGEPARVAQEARSVAGALNATPEAAIVDAAQAAPTTEAQTRSASPNGGVSSGIQFASGETRPGPFTVEEAATQALSGDRHRLRSDLFKAVDETIFGREHPTETAAVGDTASYGTEPSMVTRYDDVSPDAMRAAAAAKGYLGNQLTVLSFKRHPEGEHHVYDVELPPGMSPTSVAEHLNGVGIDYRTLQLRQDGTVRSVMVFDATSGQLKPKVESFAEQTGAPAVTVSRGAGEFIGNDESRSAAREEYRRVLQEYEALDGRADLIRQATSAFRRRVQAAPGGEGGPGEPGQQSGGAGPTGPRSRSAASDGRAGPGSAGAEGAKKAVAPGTPGRGFGVSVSDRTPKYEHSAKVLGEESEAFVRSFLEDPVHGPALEARRRGVLTGAKVDELAQRVGLSVADYKRMAQGSILPVEVQAHLANLIHAHREALTETTGHLEAARRTHDIAEAYRAEASIDELGHNMARLMMTLEASRSEAGRTLGANRLAKTKAESLAMKSLRMVMDETTLPENVRNRLAARIAAAGDNSKAVIDAVREAYLPSWWDKLIEFRVNFLLSSPLTVLRNITGNGIATATRLTENVVGLPIDLAYEGGARAIGRKGAQPQNARVASEIAWDVYGTLMGSVEGLREARRAFVDESYGAARGRVGEEALRLPAISGRPGEFVRLPSRVQSAADLFFYHQNATGRRYQLAARQAVHEGNTGPALRARIDQLARQSGAVEERLMARIANGEIKPKNDAERIAASAHAYGEEFTFRNKLGKFAGAIDRARNVDTVAGHAAKTVIPFFRTPVNISKFASQRSVLGFVSPRNWSDIVKSGNRDVIVSSVARMAIGAGTAAALTHLALGGYISGSGPKDRAAREALERTGWQPYSVRIGDTWYSYRGLSPASEQLAMAAEMGETIMASKRGEGVDLGTLGRIGLSIAKTNLDQPMWTGATDLIDAVRSSDTEWGERNLSGRVSNLASTYIVPRGVAFAARAGDPTRRAFPEDLSSMLEQGVPGLREKTLPWRDALGRGYESPSAALQAFVPHRSDQPASRLDRWLFEIQDSPERAVIPYPDRTQLGRRLSPEDYDRLQIARGELLVPALEGLRPKLEGKDRLVGQKAIGELVPTMTRAAVDRVIPDAELRALELEPSDAGRRAVLAVMHEPLVREVYSMPDRTEDEKRQILELVSKAPTDPRAQAALKALVLSRGGGGSPEGP